MKLILTASAVIVASLLLSACGDKSEEAKPATPAPAAETTKPVEAPAPEAAKPAPAAEAAKPAEAPAASADAGVALGGADFVGQASGLDGKLVTLTLCSLETTPNNGQLACRVVDAEGKDVKDKDNLPVDVFFKIDGLDAASQDYVKTTCAENLCPTKITGTLKFSPGTNFIEFVGAKLASAK